VDDLADRLNQILAQKGLIASDIAKATGITPPVMSRYLSGKSGISARNLIKLSQYLNVSANWLQDGSDAPQSIKMPKSVSVDKDKIIEVQGALIGNLQKQIKEMEKAKADSAKRHSKKRKK
jgi:transcriptional regulator with XRE-family HTH domain